MNSFLKIIMTGGIAALLTSCAVQDPYGNTNYPNRYPNENVYRAPDGTVYRQGQVYRDRNGNVYQNGRVIQNGRNYGKDYRNPRHLPPGQAKKVYGGSAKDYNRGHNKDKKYYKPKGKHHKDWDKKKKWK